MASQKLTIMKIAKLAGVSKSTVSRVLNDYPHVREEVRQKVLKVVSETGYKRNQVARMLASNRSNMLGLVIPSSSASVFTDPYFPALTRGISLTCRQHSITLALFLCESLQEADETIQSILMNGLLDGIIVTADYTNNTFENQIIDNDMPCVFIGTPQRHETVSYIDTDNFAGGVLATEHLIECGYERIAIIGSDKNLSADERFKGYQHALEKHGRVLDDSLIRFGDYSMESGTTAMSDLLIANPDAVFATSDTMAVGALRVLKEHEIQIPEQLGIIGFDDLSPAIQADPQLTTIHQPIQRTGELAVETILQLLQNPMRPPRQLKLPVELVVRDSTR